MTPSDPTPRPTYHHGNLREALQQAALAAIRESGAHALSVRSIARDVGVDVAAVYRHFRNKAALLEDMRQQAYGLLGQRMVQTSAGTESAESRLRAVGRAYVEFALDEPQLFRLIFGPMYTPPTGKQGSPPYRMLTEALEQVAVETKQPLDIDLAATFAWSAVHGLASLAVDGRLSDDDVRSAVSALLHGVTTGLAATVSR